LTALGAHAAGFSAARRCLRFLVIIITASHVKNTMAYHMKNIMVL